MCSRRRGRKKDSGTRETLKEGENEEWDWADGNDKGSDCHDEGKDVKGEGKENNGA